MKNIKVYLIISFIIVLIFSSLFFSAYQENKSRENFYEQQKNIASEHRKEIFKEIREKNQENQENFNEEEQEEIREFLLELLKDN